VILGDLVQAICAELDPLNYSALVRNVVDNNVEGLVLPDQVAISAATGKAHLRHAKYSGGHRLVPDRDTSDTIEVPSRRLDDWCERLSIDPHLVTIDDIRASPWFTDDPLCGCAPPRHSADYRWQSGGTASTDMACR
jgi:FkbM family methyltransferase